MIRNKGKVLIAAALAAVILVASCNSGAVKAYANLAVKIAIQIATLCGAPQSATDRISADVAKAEALYADLTKAAAVAKPGILSQIDAELTTAQTDLESILSLAQIKNEKVISAARAGLAIGIMAVESIRTISAQSVGGKGAVSAVASAAAKTGEVILPGGITSGKNKPLSPKQLKAAYNNALAEFPQAQLK
jgi:hypothetical protein